MSTAVNACDRSNLEVFADTLMEMAETDPNLLVVTSDSRGSGKLEPFGKRFPAQIVEVGIAEQSLVGVAAGLASTGKKVFAVSPACFLTARALEQIKVDVAYSDNPVVVVGISAGVSYGALGSTHHSLHDLAALRAIHNLTLTVPADSFETRQAVFAAVQSAHPVYLRFGKRPLPTLHLASSVFSLGRSLRLRQGVQLTFIATGEALHPCLEAAVLLEQSGISAGVISMHTVKPLDEQALAAEAAAGRILITVEEHMVHGGLGEACASFLLRNGLHPPFDLVGIPDEDTYTGSQMEIFGHYGLTGAGLAARALRLVAGYRPEPVLPGE